MLKRKKYRPGFKREAIELARRSEVSCRQIAQEIGVAPSLLSRRAPPRHTEARGRRFPGLCPKQRNQYQPSAVDNSHRRSQSFVADWAPFDKAGRRTTVAGIALYGDVEACDRSNFWLYNGKVMSRYPHTNNAIYDEHTVEATSPLSVG